MSIINWVSTMLGFDSVMFAEYDYLIVGVAAAILVIMFSTVFTFLMNLGGIFSKRD